MDLTNQPNIKISYSLDPDTNILYMTFMDDLGVVLGMLTIENTKVRSLMDTLSLISQEQVTTLMTQIGYRSSYDVQANTAEVIFG